MAIKPEGGSNEVEAKRRSIEKPADKNKNGYLQIYLKKCKDANGDVSVIKMKRWCNEVVRKDGIQWQIYMA